MTFFMKLGTRTAGWVCFAFAIAMTQALVGWEPLAQAAAIIEREETNLTLEENRGIILKLETNAANVFVANPNVADVQIRSAKLLYVFGKTAGVTTIYAVDSSDNIIYSATVEVRFNVERVQLAINDLLPEAAISVKDLNGIIILTGYARSPEEADLAQQVASQLITNQGSGVNALRIINRIEVSTPTQVNLRVKIAEMSRDIIKTLGFNWDVSLATTGGSFFGFAQGADFVNRVFNDMGVEDLSRRSFSRTGDTNSAVFSNVGGRHDVNSLIDALEEEGFLSILAEPNLTTLSGEKASFLAGGEFPVPVPQTTGSSNAITVTFKQFGVSLDFTPTVLSDSKINLKVAPEVSQLSAAGAVTVQEISIPALTTRRVNTTVELGSGQSFAIAGLLQSDIQQQVSKYPILGDIPILGTLFRSDNFQRMETELVVVVTPYIVRPVDPEELITPFEINSLPTDTGRWIKGKRDLKGSGGLDTGEGG